MKSRNAGVKVIRQYHKHDFVSNLASAFLNLQKWLKSSLVSVDIDRCIDSNVISLDSFQELRPSRMILGRHNFVSSLASEDANIFEVS
jgi:hypothetical protein